MIAGVNSPSHQQSFKLPRYGVLGCLDLQLSPQGRKTPFPRKCRAPRTALHESIGHVRFPAINAVGFTYHSSPDGRQSAQGVWDVRRRVRSEEHPAGNGETPDPRLFLYPGTCIPPPSPCPPHSPASFIGQSRRADERFLTSRAGAQELSGKQKRFTQKRQAART